MAIAGLHSGKWLEPTPYFKPTKSNSNAENDSFFSLKCSTVRLLWVSYIVVLELSKRVYNTLSL